VKLQMGVKWRNQIWCCCCIWTVKCRPKSQPPVLIRKKVCKKCKGNGSSASLYYFTVRHAVSTATCRNSLIYPSWLSIRVDGMNKGADSTGKVMRI